MGDDEILESDHESDSEEFMDDQEFPSEKHYYPNCFHYSLYLSIVHSQWYLLLLF